MSRERGTKTERQAMRAAEPAEVTALFPFPTLLTPHSGVRIPASPPHPPANFVDDEVTVFDFGASSAEGIRESERTALNEATKLGLFVVAREPKTEPHLPVADPFEVAEQLSGIEAAEESQRGWEAREVLSSATTEASPPSDATLCSAGVERPSRNDAEIDIPPPVMPRVILIREERRVVPVPAAPATVRAAHRTNTGAQRPWPSWSALFERLEGFVLRLFGLFKKR